MNANAVSQDIDPAANVVPPGASVGPPGAPAGAPGADLNAGQQQQQAQVVAYQSTFYGGNLPAPTGEVGQFNNRTVSTAGLKDQAEAFLNFLNDPTIDLRDLNGENTIFMAIIMVIGTQKVKVIYGMGRGTAQIGQVSPVANKMLSLFGEGGADLGTPQVIVLPDDIRAKYKVRGLTDAVIITAFQGGNQAVDQPVGRASSVTNKHDIMRIAPIPAHLVFDGFDTDLDASIVYERLMDIHDRTHMVEHAYEFIKACMVGGWRIEDVKPLVPRNEFFGMVHSMARVWANSRFAVSTPFRRVGQQQHPQQVLQAPQG